MAYATPSDMIRQFGEAEVLSLADPEHTGQIDQGTLAGALIDASAEIDSYLAGRYKNLPFNPVPRNLVRLCCNMARYHLTGTNRLETEQIKDRYDASIRYLEFVAAGKVTVGPPEGSGSTPDPVGSVQFVGGGKVFGRDKHSGAM